MKEVFIARRNGELQFSEPALRELDAMPWQAMASEDVVNAAQAALAHELRALKLARAPADGVMDFAKLMELAKHIVTQRPRLYKLSRLPKTEKDKEAVVTEIWERDR